MAPFVALHPAAPITTTTPPFYVKDTLNCKTSKWGGRTTFTGKKKKEHKIPLVIDIFIVASEMDLMESRLYELHESVDYVIVGISPKNHRGDPQPNWYQHALDRHQRFPASILSKIILVNVGICDEHLAATSDMVYVVSFFFYRFLVSSRVVGSSTSYCL